MFCFRSQVLRRGTKFECVDFRGTVTIEHGRVAGFVRNITSILGRAFEFLQIPTCKNQRMRVLTFSLIHSEAGRRFALSSTHLNNLILCACASGAVGIKTSATGGKRSSRREGELVLANPTAQRQGDSTHEQIWTSANTSKYAEQKLSFSSRGDARQFTVQQQNTRSDELLPAGTMETLLALSREDKWQALVTMLTGSPAKQNLERMSDCFDWLGRSGKQKASVTLLELLNSAGESEKKLSQYLQVFISSFADCYGTEPALRSFKAVEETVHLKPGITLFEDLIRGFCNQGQLSRAMDVLDEIQHRGLTLRSTSFIPLLKSFSDHLMLDEAFETLATMRRVGLETSIANYNVLMGACVRAGDMEKAYRVLTELQQQGIQPDTTSFNHLMKGFAKERRLKRALSIVQEMDYIGLKPNKETYVILLRACGTNKDLNEATKLFRKVEGLGLGTDQTVLSAMIQAYVDNSQLDPALKLVNKLELKGTSVGVEAKSQLLRGLALAGRLEEATEVYGELGQSGKLPSPDSVATLLATLSKVGRIGEMLKIFQETNCSGSWSDYQSAYRTSYLNVFCIHICLGYIRCKQPEGAVKFLQHISKLGMTNNKILYDKIFLHVAGSGYEGQGTSTLDAADGLALLRALKGQGIQLSRMAHETLLDLCTSSGKSEEAWEIFQEMEKECLPLNIMSKIRLFRVFVASRKDHDAEKVLRKISNFDLLDRDVRLLLQKIVELEFQRSEAGSARDVTSFRHLLAIQERLKQHMRFQKGNN